MRTVIALFAVLGLIGGTGCKKKSQEPAGSTGSAMTGSADMGSAGSAMGSGEGSADGSGSAGSGSDGAAAATGDTPMSQKGGNCPSLVFGATTKSSLQGKNVVVTISATDKDAIAAIQKRATELLKEKADNAPSTPGHDQKGTHGGSMGLCPVYVPEGATTKAKPDKNGVAITISPKDKPDALKTEIDARIAKAAEWARANIKEGDKGNAGGVGGGAGEHGSNHSGEGDGKGKDRMAAGGAGPATTCAKDADCALVDECCGCSAGGKKLAISASAVKDYNASRAQRCADLACATVMSDDPSCGPKAKAVCDSGKCKVGGDGSGGGKGTGGGGGKGGGGGSGKGSGT
ncbi:MAG: hypothetical protein AB7P03_27470 [Kofleriaceae bacterium]